MYKKEAPAFIFDPHYLVTLKPNTKKGYQMSVENGGEIVWWQTNSQGFRGPKMLDEPDYRIIIYGDSNIQGRFSSLENTFAFQLQKLLRVKTGKNIEVINAGVVSAGPDQYLIRFKKEYEKYKPDLVLFHITTDNDFGDILRNRLFDLDEHGDLVKSSHALTVDTFIMQWKKEPGIKEYINSLLLVKAGNKILTKTFGIEKQEVIDMYLNLCESEYEVFKNRAPRRYSHFQDHYEYDLSFFPQKESSTLKVKLMSAVLKEAKAFADSVSIPFFVSIHPSIFDITTNAMISYEDYFGYDNYNQRNLTNLVEEICVSLGINSINLFPVFYQNAPNSLYLKTSDDHWNNKGQALAAETIGEIIYNQIFERADSSLSQ